MTGPDPRYFLGSGKAQELRELAHSSEADVILVDHALSPSQERNLERLLQCRVVDRVSLILDFFACNARKAPKANWKWSCAAQAHLSRLVRGWTHLSGRRAESACAARAKHSSKPTAV